MCINKFKFTINGVPVIILVVFFYRHEKILKLILVAIINGSNNP